LYHKVLENGGAGGIRTHAGFNSPNDLAIGSNCLHHVYCHFLEPQKQV